MDRRIPDLAWSHSKQKVRRMKIVVLDGYAMNPGDLSWTALQQLGTVEIYDRTPVAETLSRIGDATVVLTNKAVLTGSVIRSAPRLKYIGVMATGYNVVDLDAAKEKGIVVTNVPTYSTVSVAQFTFAMILSFCNNVAEYCSSVDQGDWVRSDDFSYQLSPQIELQDKTLAIVGLGKIGQAVARIGLAFGMRVIAAHKHPERDAMAGVTFTDLNTCFQTADFLSLHAPLNADNKGFVDKANLQQMKSTAFLINTSRGPLVNEADLADALNSGRIAGAALDVLSIEPPEADNPLFQAKNCRITPHIAWATFEARSRLMDVVVDNIRQWSDGRPVNVVV